MSMLNLGKQRPLIRRELSRRIGYTNGLHEIFRFGRVVSYLHQIAPASSASLRAAILQQEKIRGAKYADGVIDVARALGLIGKAGVKFTLSDKGYALHAVLQMDNSIELERALLLNAVLVSDGEASLNLLNLLAKGTPPELLGPMLVGKLLQALELRTHWARQNIEAKFAKDIVLHYLSESKERLRLAVDLNRKQDRALPTYKGERGLTPDQKVVRFYDHTVKPRRGWLKDLGCVEIQGRSQYKVTESGYRLLATFKDTSCYVESVFLLPLSTEVMETLGVAESGDSEDLFWQATAQFFFAPTSPARLSRTDLFKLIQRVYPHVKLHLFNEATVESIYVVMSARLALVGKYLGRRSFQELLDLVVLEFSGKIYRLRQRQGGSGYVALRGFSR